MSIPCVTVSEKVSCKSWVACWLNHRITVTPSVKEWSDRIVLISLIFTRKHSLFICRERTTGLRVTEAKHTRTKWVELFHDKAGRLREGSRKLSYTIWLLVPRFFVTSVAVSPELRVIGHQINNIVVENEVYLRAFHVWWLVTRLTVSQMCVLTESLYIHYTISIPKVHIHYVHCVVHALSL